METYQPLNSYSFCKTVNKRGIEKQAKPNSKKISITNPFLYKVFTSVVVLFVILIATVIVKIEASEPISYELAAGETQVVVGSGDSFWKIASIHYPDIEDKSFAIYLMKERNGLDGNDIYPGQVIILPYIK